MSLSRGFIDLFICSLEITVTNVVEDIRVKEGSVLRDNTDRSTERVESHSFDVLSVDQNLTRIGIVEAEEEPEDGGFAAPRWTNDGYFLTGWDLKRKVAEDRAFRMVGKSNIPELNLSTLEMKRFSSRCVFDRRIKRLEVKHDIHVDKALTKFAVDCAEEVEGKGKLEDELVYEDEVTHSHSTCKFNESLYEHSQIENRVDIPLTIP